MTINDVYIVEPQATNKPPWMEVFWARFEVKSAWWWVGNDCIAPIKVSQWMTLTETPKDTLVNHFTIINASKDS